MKTNAEERADNAVADMHTAIAEAGIAVALFYRRRLDTLSDLQRQQLNLAREAQARRAEALENLAKTIAGS